MTATVRHQRNQASVAREFTLWTRTTQMQMCWVYLVGKGIRVSLLLTYVEVPMQLDTGAAVSIMPESTYKSILSKYSLHKSKLILNSYTGDQIPIADK